jgi:hypothetical protein
LFSMLGYRLLLWLRSLIKGAPHRQQRVVRSASVDELAKVDACYAAAVGLGMIDVIQGAAFQARHLLLALRAGERTRIARALARDASLYAAFAQDRRAAKTLETAASFVQDIPDPSILGMIRLSEGGAAYLQGRWKESLRLCGIAEEIFRQKCVGVHWELVTAQTTRLYSHFFLGNMAELKRSVSVAREEAEKRGDLYALGSMIEAICLVPLMADDSERAWAELYKARESLPLQEEGYYFQHQNSLSAQVQIALFCGKGDEAWQYLQRNWSKVVRSELLRIQFLRVMQLQLRARSALAVALNERRPEPLLRAVERDAGRLERERKPYAQAMAALLRAGVAAARGQKERAVKWLAKAVIDFEAVDMRLYAAAARYRQSELLADERLLSHASSWMNEQEIQNPSRMTAMLAPGFPN